MIVLFFLSTDGGIISNFEEDSKIIEVNTKTTLKWKLQNVPIGRSFYDIYFFINGDKLRLLYSYPERNSVNKSLAYYYKDAVPNNNIFVDKRIRGYLELNNGNGTLIVTISNVQYNESGLFRFEYIGFIGGIIDESTLIREKIDLTLVVQGIFIYIILSKFDFYFLSKNVLIILANERVLRYVLIVKFIFQRISLSM